MSATPPPPPGAIRTDFTRPDAGLVAGITGFPTATLHEAAGRTGALPSAIKPIAPGFSLCGAVVTVDSPPADNLWLHRAIYAAAPGDVLVVTVGGQYEAGYWGEIMATAAIARGLGGLVIDGCVRDGAILAEMGFPVFARGLCIRGTGKDFFARGWINAPILIGDVTVEAGDIVRGDSDGVVVVARDMAAATIARSRAREDKEAQTMEALKKGARTLDLYGWS
jgi:4-hydroxy-4-methyl-2-oxoglutarate aldolase